MPIRLRVGAGSCCGRGGGGRNHWSRPFSRSIKGESGVCWLGLAQEWPGSGALPTCGSDPVPWTLPPFPAGCWRPLDAHRHPGGSSLPAAPLRVPQRGWQLSSSDSPPLSYRELISRPPSPQDPKHLSTALLESKFLLPLSRPSPAPTTIKLLLDHLAGQWISSLFLALVSRCFFCSHCSPGLRQPLPRWYICVIL